MPLDKSNNMSMKPPSLDIFPMANGPQRINNSRSKKPLAPGHSPMDWAKLKNNTPNLSNVDQIRRYTMEDMLLHNKKEDLWMSFNGKIYNVTPYNDYHPGGIPQLMRTAGKDSTELINKIHPWVNIDSMMDKCLVGYLVREL